jgi:hypothetical protein
MIDFPEVAPGEPLVVSATLFVTYGRCPDQALGRMRGLYPPESRASFKGGLAHRVFARHLSGGEIGPEELDQVCREEIGSSMNPKLGSLGLKPSQLKGVINEVGELYERFKTMSTEGFRASEVQLEVDPVEDLTLRGSIDAVFEDGARVRLIDWKTGGLYEVERQLDFYSLLWALDRNELPSQVEAVSITSGERVIAKPSLTSVSATADEAAQLATELRGAFDDGRDQLERLAGPWCRYCALLDTCDEGGAAVRVSEAG